MTAYFNGLYFQNRKVHLFAEFVLVIAVIARENCAEWKGEKFVSMYRYDWFFFFHNFLIIFLSCNLPQQNIFYYYYNFITMELKIQRTYWGDEKNSGFIFQKL